MSLSKTLLDEDRSPASADDDETPSSRIKSIAEKPDISMQNWITMAIGK